jgi:small subunit ribosomal protein S9
MALAPLYLGNMQNYEVRLFVRGGGKRGKAQSCQNAMARAIVKLKPELKNYFRHQGMITLDKRNKEPKHLNLYKARRRYPFVRR